jgi:uroporphyrinogen decarboxylase
MQPECMPVDEVIGKYRDRLGFWGTIGIQTTMPFGTADDVRAAVRTAADYARSGVPLVVSPTHTLEPDVTWRNIEALVEEVHRPL